MAHRLPNLEGKCQQIHGHSWWCELTINGHVGEHGILIDFASVKKVFREHLDGKYDHHLALSVDDPLLAGVELAASSNLDFIYPGLVVVPDDPTVENMAKWIGEYMRKQFGLDYGYHVKLWEAATNAATWEG
jgi:6-pyruvoyltetrahydropterin/6-carboxytetrahydropterin synthase